MALVIESTFAAALSERADKYLQLAQSSYADGKPSRQLFELAIKDFAAALARTTRISTRCIATVRSLSHYSVGIRTPPPGMCRE